MKSNQVLKVCSRYVYMLYTKEQDLKKEKKSLFLKGYHKGSTNSTKDTNLDLKHYKCPPWQAKKNQL